MIPTPIRQVLSTFQTNGVQALLMGGQACIFYGAAQVSKDVEDVDVMTRLRGMPEFAALWERRTAFAEPGGIVFNLLSVPDLVGAKKTQRSKDWPVIELLVAIHYRENGGSPRPEWIEFWLKEARSPEMLVELCRRFPAAARALSSARPLLTHAIADDLAALRPALDAEVRAEQDKDRAYWEPLKRELEALRLAEAHERSGPNTG